MHKLHSDLLPWYRRLMSHFLTCIFYLEFFAIRDWLLYRRPARLVVRTALPVTSFWTEVNSEVLDDVHKRNNRTVYWIWIWNPINRRSWCNSDGSRAYLLDISKQACKTRGSAIAEEPRDALGQLKYYGRFLTELLTRSSANPEEPCEHNVSWNRVKCCTNVRRIACEKVCNRWMTFSVIQGHCCCHHLIGHILFPISLPL